MIIQSWSFSEQLQCLHKQRVVCMRDSLARSLARDIFSAAARQVVALVVLRHSKDLFLPFNDVESERQRPTDNRLHPHELVVGSEYLYRSVRLRTLASLSTKSGVCLPLLTTMLH